MTTATDRRVEYLPIDAIQGNPRNPKEHDEPGIAASIGRFGFIEPLVLDERTGQLASGHGRLAELRARQAQGGSPPEGIELRDGAWCAPVVRGWASADDREAEALLVAVNRLTERGGWHDRNLLAMLDAIAGGDAEGLAGTGFDLAALDDLAALVQEEEPWEEEGAGGDRYGQRAVRSIVLDYPKAEFARVVELANQARADRHVKSNAALFVALLEERFGG